MTFKRATIALAAAALVAAACGGGGDDTSTTTPESSTTESTTPDVTTPAPTDPPTTDERVDATAPPAVEVPDVPRQPLTGEPIADVDDIVDRPALAVKIDNHPDARSNHSGLAVADIVFEELVEGSLTRFAAVFHSIDADPIGPIRSGREQDVDILSSLNEPLFGWSGGNPGVTALIRASFLVDLNHQNNTSSYYRGPGGSPHNLYSSSEALYELTPDDHPGAPPQQFEYLPEGGVVDGEAATTVELTIGSIDIGWDWNADEGRYERSQEGSEHVDKTYGRVGAENVIVVVVDYVPSSIDSNAPKAESLGEGPVYVFTDGKLIRGRWSRELAVYKMKLTDERGEPILLTPGQTWIELAQAISNGDPDNPDVNLQFS